MLRLGRQAVDVAAVRDAVGAVVDPELQRPLGELDMIRGVTAGRNGRVEVEVALTTPGCPMTELLARDVAAAASTVPEIGYVRVNFTVMPESERRALADRVLTHRDTGATAASAVYAVASGKGGVGKSSVAANLAVALARTGKSVGLLDADVWGYSVPQLFGVRRSPIAMYHTMFPVQAHGVRLMSLGFLTDEDEPVVWRGPMLHKALTQFVHDVHWGQLDVLLLDLPPGTGDVTLSVLELLPDASLLAVTTPQQAARSVASRVGVMARDMGMPIAGVVENMSELVCPHCSGRSELFGAGGGQRLADELNAPLLGQIPLDAAMRAAGDSGVPVVSSAPESPSAQALIDVAAALRPARRPLVGRSLGVQPVG
ncbi:P-loop NTPase [Mycolicibacterium agri]|uniref:Iron-sulfur cluster carrier protein n=1 Tax=Mycolicibacterium agri TaxID=36811 RepID=A0A7I9VZS6_MYCAG|nr:P-loop NTPase [Mycolicibacterium agri]GFG50955.1 iron-sulfur cluster carrier protein [Mycolicibacterium agri]